MTFTYQLQVLHCCSLQSVRSKCHVIRQERIYHEKFCGLAHVFCIVHIFYCANTLHVPLIIKHLAIASAVFVAFWLVLPFGERNNFIQFIKSILKSLVILAIWFALSGAINLRIAPFFALNHIIFSANENVTVKQNEQSDFRVNLKKPLKF